MNRARTIRGMIPCYKSDTEKCVGDENYQEHRISSAIIEFRRNGPARRQPAQTRCILDSQNRRLPHRHHGHRRRLLGCGNWCFLVAINTSQFGGGGESISGRPPGGAASSTLSTASTVSRLARPGPSVVAGRHHPTLLWVRTSGGPVLGGSVTTGDAAGNRRWQVPVPPTALITDTVGSASRRLGWGGGNARQHLVRSSIGADGDEVLQTHCHCRCHRLVRPPARSQTSSTYRGGDEKRRSSSIRR